MDLIRPDLVLKNATVITVDREERLAESVAIRGEKIIGVGSNKEIASLIGEETRVLDLTGKTVVPGFIDSHTHNTFFGGFHFHYNLLDLAFDLNPTIPQLQEKIALRAQETPKGEWIGGRNLEPMNMEEGRWPTREELDEVSPANPLVISIRGGHAHVLNSLALEKIGITKETPNPEGGIIEKDPETCKPTGVLRDVWKLIHQNTPQTTLEDIKDGLIYANREHIKTGVTSTGDAGTFDLPDSYRAYQELISEGRFKIRTYLMVFEEIYRQKDLGLRTGFGNNRLRLGAMKLFVDGSIQCFTCAFYDPYLTKDTKGHEGLVYTQEELNAVVLDGHTRGCQVAIHAQGDYGITMAINAIENAMEKHPRPDPRHRIEHLLCPTYEDLKRIKDLGIVASFYLFHPWFWGDQHMNTFIGEERAKRMVPVKTAMEMGIICCAHSDSPVCTPSNPVWPSNPLFGMWCAVNRKTKKGFDIGSEERLTPIEALKAYTINGAYATFEEDIKGSIEEGKLADMVVLKENPLVVDKEKIRDIEIEKTIIGGEILYDSSKG